MCLEASRKGIAEAEFGGTMVRRHKENRMTDPIDKMMEELPPDLQEEVRDFARFLLLRKRRPSREHLRMSWAGGLNPTFAVCGLDARKSLIHRSGRAKVFTTPAAAPSRVPAGVPAARVVLR
jgi:hypothetical protein